MSTVSTTLLEANLPGLHLRHRGKVRDVFDLGDERLLIVATDRLSAFDVVLPDPIPGKGEMLCQISNFWFEKTAHLMPNHLTGIPVEAVLPEGVDPAAYVQRSVVTRRLKPVPVEAIARGYVIGSGWKDYQRTGRISGIRLPDGLRQAEQLAEHQPAKQHAGDRLHVHHRRVARDVQPRHADEQRREGGAIEQHQACEGDPAGAGAG